MSIPSLFTTRSPVDSETGLYAIQRTGGAYERKYSLPTAQASSLIAAARELLALDPFALAAGGSYEVHTLYFDTRELDVYYRIGPCRNAKYRIRRYGSEDIVHLERKSKPEGRVRKHRSQIPIYELGQLNRSDGEDWAGNWFRRRLHARGLLPVCQVSYSRTAMVGDIERQAVRLTIDRSVRCESRRRITRPEPLRRDLELLPGECILEVKFSETMPQRLGDLIDDLGLQHSQVSKYRLAAQTLGLPDLGAGAQCNAWGSKVAQVTASEGRYANDAPFRTHPAPAAVRSSA